MPAFKTQVGKHLLQTSILALKIFDLFNIGDFHTTIFCFPVIIAGLKDGSLTAHIFDGSASFDRFQNGDNLVLSESDLAHRDLLAKDIISMLEYL